MKYNIDYTIAIYTENEKGSFDELIVDIYNQGYEYISDCNEQMLFKASEKNLKEFHVEQDFFLAFYQTLENNYSGSFSFNGYNVLDAKQYELEEKKKPLIKKEKIWQAIRWELDESELDRIISFDYRYEKDDYYDFDLMIDKIHAFMNGEKTVSYFNGWCILLMRCFMHNMKCRSKKLHSLYYDLGDFFDGAAFMSLDISQEEKLKESRENIAILKYFNHEISDVKAKSQTDFTTNGVITYVAFAFSVDDGRYALYNVCVVDMENDKINYLIIPDMDYDERINYTLLSQAEFNDLSCKYFDDYALDTSMTVDYALAIVGKNRK